MIVFDNTKVESSLQENKKLCCVDVGFLIYRKILKIECIPPSVFHMHCCRIRTALILKALTNFEKKNARSGLHAWTDDDFQRNKSFFHVPYVPEQLLLK